MDYTPLRRLKNVDKQRVIGGLRKLRTGLLQDVPRKGPGNLLLASWNIREFGGTKYGGRMEDARFFIAECMNHFDLIAVQEVRRDLRALRDVMRLLGPNWDVVFTDVSYAQGGNSERMAFVFDKNQVFFTGLAGELVLPPSKSKVVAQIARTPFICGFQAGWAKFNLCTVHIYYGTGDENPRRVEEIEQTAQLLAKKADDYLNPGRQAYSPENLVLLGDFNIANTGQKTYQALTGAGFVIPKSLQKLPGSNVKGDKAYDQIAFYKEAEGISCDRAGVFDFFKYVYTAADEPAYAELSGATNARNYADWRTYQMSDHLIMWAQFNVDKTDSYLDDVARAEPGLTPAPAPAARKSAKRKSPPGRKTDARKK